MEPPSDAGEEGAIERGRALLRGASGVVVLTGAGISVESGVPTFRGEEGLWKDHRPEELATPAAFRRDPRTVWQWYAWRRERVRACEPNAAHLALAGWSARREDVTLVTQNVDGLHAEALCRVGAPAEAHQRLVELHGSLFRVRCTSCSHGAGHREPVATRTAAALPRCPACGELLRPDVVWFGESLEAAQLEAAFAAARSAGVCLVVGTSGVVQPAASVATAAAEHGASVVEVNPESTPLSRLAAVRLRLPAGSALPELLGYGGGEDGGDPP